MSTSTINLTPELYHYYHEHSLREHPVLQALRERTQQEKQAVMQISPEQGQFMTLLMQLIGAKKTLEVGTFTGYSSLAVALGLPDDGQVIACDISDEWQGLATEHWQQAEVAHKIDLRIAPALDSLNALLEAGEAGTFDFAFIDADKRNQLAYYEKSLELVRQGGLITIDNVLWSGKVADPSVRDESTQAIRELNDFIHKDQRVTMSMLPIGDGLTLVRKS